MAQEKDLRTDICPYCSQKLKKIPGSKTKCPHCGNHIYVRTNSKKEIVTCTEKQLNEIEFDWELQRLKQWILNQVWYEPQSEVLKDLNQTKDKWDLENQKYTIEDLEVCVYNFILHQSALRKNYFAMAEMHRNLAGIDIRENKDPIKNMELAEKYSKMCDDDLNKKSEFYAETQPTIVPEEIKPKRKFFTNNWFINLILLGLYAFILISFWPLTIFGLFVYFVIKIVKK